MNFTPREGAVTLLTLESCVNCRRLKMMLHRDGIPFTEVTINDNDEAREFATAAGGGAWRLPTVVFSTGEVAVLPGLREVRAGLARIAGEH